MWEVTVRFYNIFFFKWNGPSIYMNSLNTAKWKDE